MKTLLIVKVTRIIAKTANKEHAMKNKFARLLPLAAIMAAVLTLSAPAFAGLPRNEKEELQIEPDRLSTLEDWLRFWQRVWEWDPTRIWRWRAETSVSHPAPPTPPPGQNEFGEDELEKARRGAQWTRELAESLKQVAEQTKKQAEKAKKRAEEDAANEAARWLAEQAAKEAEDAAIKANLAEFDAQAAQRDAEAAERNTGSRVLNSFR
jgi:hypothetical protein